MAYYTEEQIKQARSIDLLTYLQTQEPTELVKLKGDTYCTREHDSLKISYNPKEIASPTVSQRPDNVLSLYKNGSRNNYEYVFDAKYRINPAYPETDYYRNISHSPGPEIDDKACMVRVAEIKEGSGSGCMIRS